VRNKGSILRVGTPESAPVTLYASADAKLKSDLGTALDVMGAWDKTITGGSWNYEAKAWKDTASQLWTGGANEMRGVAASVYVDSTTLAGLSDGDNLTAYRCYSSPLYNAVYGTPRDAINVTQLDSVRYAGASPGVPFSEFQATNATVNVVSGDLQIQPEITKTYNSVYVDFNNYRIDRRMGYRYLRLRFRTVGAAEKSLKLSLTNPAYSTTTIIRMPTISGADGEWVEREFDLFAEPTVANGYTHGHTVLADGIYFHNMTPRKSGETWRFEIDYIDQFRKNAPKLTVLNHQPNLAKVELTSDNLLIGEYYVGDTSEPDVNYTALATRMTRAIAGVTASAVNTAPGGLGYPNKPYPLSALPVLSEAPTGLSGGGLLSTKDRLGSIQACGRTKGGTLDRPYQVTFPPGAGDVLNQGEWSPNIVVNFKRVAGFQFVGSVITKADGSGTNQAASVTITETATPEGRGSPGSDQWYATESPFGRVIRLSSESGNASRTVANKGVVRRHIRPDGLLYTGASFLFTPDSFFDGGNEEQRFFARWYVDPSYEKFYFSKLSAKTGFTREIAALNAESGGVDYLSHQHAKRSVVTGLEAARQAEIFHMQGSPVSVQLSDNGDLSAYAAPGHNGGFNGIHAVVSDASYARMTADASGGRIIAALWKGDETNPNDPADTILRVADSVAGTSYAWNEEKLLTFSGATTAPVWGGQMRLKTRHDSRLAMLFRGQGEDNAWFIAHAPHLPVSGSGNSVWETFKAPGQWDIADLLYWNHLPLIAGQVIERADDGTVTNSKFVAYLGRWKDGAYEWGDPQTIFDFGTDTIPTDFCLVERSDNLPALLTKESDTYILYASHAMGMKGALWEKRAIGMPQTG
jgi:hypothetical protein